MDMIELQRGIYAEQGGRYRIDSLGTRYEGTLAGKEDDRLVLQRGTAHGPSHFTNIFLGEMEEVPKTEFTERRIPLACIDKTVGVD